MNLFDNNYLSNSKQLQNFIQLGKKHLTVAHFDYTANQYVGLSSRFLGENENWFSAVNAIQSTLSQLNFSKSESKINISFVDPIYTLVPKALFDQAEVETYLKFNHPINDIDLYDLHVDIVENFQLVIVFAVPKAVCSLFNNISAIKRIYILCLLLFKECF